MNILEDSSEEREVSQILPRDYQQTTEERTGSQNTPNDK
jgi:hypothetical protein